MCYCSINVVLNVDVSFAGRSAASTQTPLFEAHMTQQPSRKHLKATLILACLAQFMVILDISVINVALPAIKHSLNFSESGLQWVVNAYTVTFAGFLLLCGRAADLLGRRRVFVAGLLLFSVASLAGGLAGTSSELIIARLVQGLGGAIIAPASLSILTSTFTEPAERHRAVGIWGAMGGAGGAAGVLLGGIIVDLISWRWILFINIPIGVASAFFAQRMLQEGRNEGATRNFDFAGALTATIGPLGPDLRSREDRHVELGLELHADPDGGRNRAAGGVRGARGSLGPRRRWCRCGCSVRASSQPPT